jgi:sodium/bile acid cotransporter 7
MFLLTLFRSNWFILAILLSFSLGLWLPGGAAILNPGGRVKPLLVYALLFLAGLAIPTERILEDLKEYRLHLFVQAVIFIVYPLVTWLLLLPFGGMMHPWIRTGILALSCLPATVSSCIVFTQVSGGNVTAAVFNAAVSNALGVIATPLLFSLLISSDGAAFQAVSAYEVFLGLFRIILLPILAGQAVRMPLRKSADTHKRALSMLSNLIIFFLIYFAVARSSQAILSSASFALFALPLVFLSVLNVLILLGLYYAGRLAGFSEQDRLTALYVGSHKTLALGLPLTAAVFGADSPGYGFIILPLLFYYNIQLVSSGVIRSYIAPRLFSCSDEP